MAARGAAPYRRRSTTRCLQSTELLVVSPGVPLTEPAVARAIAAGIEVVGDVELFARAIRALNAKREHPMRVLAITGSNGKSTVTAMCGDMCRMAGLDHLRGRQHRPAGAGCAV